VNSFYYINWRGAGVVGLVTDVLPCGFVTHTAPLGESVRTGEPDFDGEPMFVSAENMSGARIYPTRDALLAELEIRQSWQREQDAVERLRQETIAG
jgi:hypothetical protein